MATGKLLNLPDNAIQQWKEFNCGSTQYNFAHLNACKHTYSHPERNEIYTLYFTFSHHVFTQSIKENEHVPQEQIYPYPLDKRAFNLERFKLSKYLPEIIATLPEQFCYHGGYSRYCSCKITQEDGTKVNYQVVYRVWKQRGKLRFHVESAYPLTGKLGRKKKVNFWVICHNLLKNKTLPQPAK